MTVRYLLDEDLSPAVAETARGLGLDAVSVHEIGRRGFSDGEQLDYAVRQRRTMVTRNRDDFIALTVEAFRTGTAHHGVLIVPRSLPNHRPEAIAHALRRWHEEHRRLGAAVSYVIDFLPS